MNLQSMDYMIAIAEEKSITNAAKRLHVTQQTLSAHLSGLEKELGCQLFRRRVPLELTYAGEQFMQYARAIHAQTQQCRRSMQEIAGEEKGLLQIGITHIRGSIVLPPILMDFHRHHPGIDLKIIEGTNDELIAKCRLGALDLCISDFSDSTGMLQTLALYQENVVFVIDRSLFARLPRQNRPISDAPVLSYSCSELSALLRQCPLLISHEQDISGKFARRMIDTLPEAPDIRAEAANVELLLQLCIRGLGGCFCPDIIVRHILTPLQLQNVQLISLGKASEYTISIGWREDAGIISSFIDSARRVSHTADPLSTASSVLLSDTE